MKVKDLPEIIVNMELKTVADALVSVGWGVAIGMAVVLVVYFIIGFVVIKYRG